MNKSQSHYASRKGWKYIGVWERSPEKQRLHFHGLFSIPDGTMPGSLEEHSDFNLKKQKMVKTLQNTYFNERFGRSDFKVVNEHCLDDSVKYLLKYIEKTTERLVFSRGLKTFFVSDVMDEDIICPLYENEDKNKYILFDNFTCYDQGCLIGKVSYETIEQMPKAN